MKTTEYTYIKKAKKQKLLAQSRAYYRNPAFISTKEVYYICERIFTLILTLWKNKRLAFECKGRSPA